MSAPTLRPGHGDHWLAVLEEGDPRLRDVVSIPVDAPDAVALHRLPLTEAVDMVQVTRARRLVTAYPEPRATALIEGTPRELTLWETRAEAWLTLEHEQAGALTIFVTDLVEGAPRYAAAGTRRGLALELAGIAYRIDRAPSTQPPRLQPAAPIDARFIADDYAFDAEVADVHMAGDSEVLDLVFQGDLAFPVVARHPTGARAGERVRGFLWLTGRLPALP